MVLTPQDRLGNTGHIPGFRLKDFTAQCFVFRDAGVELTKALLEVLRADCGASR